MNIKEALDFVKENREIIMATEFLEPYREALGVEYRDIGESNGYYIGWLYEDYIAKKLESFLES